MSTTLPAEPSEVAEARLADIVSRFGASLSEEQRGQVRSRIERTLKLSAAMRTVVLANGDEPEIVFAPYRGDA